MPADVTGDDAALAVYTGSFGAGEEPPSEWVCRHAGLIRPGGFVLDYAAGRGRHARWLAAQGFMVEAVDRDAELLSPLADLPSVAVCACDLEQPDWPYAGRKFDGVVVSRYLHRATLPRLAELLEPQGVLIYETFMQGHERYGRPSNPDFLLRPDELREVFATRLHVVAFEQGEFDTPRPAVLQRMCAINLA